VTVRVSATPSAADDGPALADEVLAALTAVAGTGDGRPRPVSEASARESAGQ
jgi:hypothetical protein